jgi:hypothetical protein
MAMEFDKRLMLRVILLILNALAYLYNASAPAPTIAEEYATDEDADRAQRLLNEAHAYETLYARKRADENIKAARYTFSLILRQAGKTLDQLEKD